MTKEDIIQEVLKKNVSTTTVINTAMDEYAKQQCISFFEYLKRYASYGDNTPEQLYNLFIEQQTENK